MHIKKERVPGPDKRRNKRIFVEAIDVNNYMIFAKKIRVHNINISGIAFETDKKMSRNSQCMLTLREENMAVSVKGTVVRCLISGYKKNFKGVDVPVYAVAVKFTEIGDNIKDLVKFISYRSRMDHDRGDLQRLNGLRLSVRVNIGASEKDTLSFIERYRVRDISCGGMLMESKYSLKINAKFRMKISIAREQSIKVTGRIVRCRAVKDESVMRYNIGIEFIEIAEKDKERLNELVDFIDEINGSISS